MDEEAGSALLSGSIPLGGRDKRDCMSRWAVSRSTCTITGPRKRADVWSMFFIDIVDALARPGVAGGDVNELTGRFLVEAAGGGDVEESRHSEVSVMRLAMVGMNTPSDRTKFRAAATNRPSIIAPSGNFLLRPEVGSASAPLSESCE